MPLEIEELAALLKLLAMIRQDSSEPAAARHQPPATDGELGPAQYARMLDRLLVTKAEAADRLGVSVRTIERLAATGGLPQVQVERLARFRVSDLEEYVQGLSRRQGPQPESEPR